jgi:hypothetical protein
VGGVEKIFEIILGKKPKKKSKKKILVDKRWLSHTARMAFLRSSKIMYSRCVGM